MCSSFNGRIHGDVNRDTRDEGTAVNFRLVDREVRKINYFSDDSDRWVVDEIMKHATRESVESMGVS